MIQAHELKPHLEIKHLPSGELYVVDAIGRMKADGQWMSAARYHKIRFPSHGEFYRNIYDFNDFEVVYDGTRPNQETGG